MIKPSFDRRRRSLLKGTAGLAAAGALQPLLALAGRAAGTQAAGRNGDTPFGPLRPVADDATGLALLELPEGFSYSSFSWTGDAMADGRPTPPRHDGMAVVDAAADGTLTLLRNHENLLGQTIGAAPAVYDAVEIPASATPNGASGPLGGGVTRLRWRAGRWLGAEPVLGGTLVNCAGGPTPWGSWLSGEEGVFDLAGIGGKLHGFLFEAPASGIAPAIPLTAMGLFKHEAAAVDSDTGIVYMTEDNGDHSGLYRFLPKRPLGGTRSLEAGGRLQMLAVTGETKADLRTPEAGLGLDTHWVDIDDPVMRPERQDGALRWVGRSGPYLQGRQKGGARFRRLEGCWIAEGRLVFADTVGGADALGAIWALRPQGADRGRLEAIFVSPNSESGEKPDNLTLRPGAGIVFCEDGPSPNRVMALDAAGRSFPLARNAVQLSLPDITGMDRDPGVLRPMDYTGSEWAGACFSPDGQTLFVNLQTPGITFAVTSDLWPLAG